MNILRVRCRNLEEFEEYYLPDVPNGGVFCPTTTELAPGTAVVVEMACDGLPNKVLIRGNVTAWRPALPRMRIRAGATVAFEAEEADKRDFVVQTLRGERPTTRKRKHTRIPIGIPCKIRLTSALEFTDGRAARDQRQRRPRLRRAAAARRAPTSSSRSCRPAARRRSICRGASSIMRGRARPASASSTVKAAAPGGCASWSGDSRLSRSTVTVSTSASTLAIGADMRKGTARFSLAALLSATLLCGTARASHYAVADVPRLVTSDEAEQAPQGGRRDDRAAPRQGGQGQGPEGARQGLGPEAGDAARTGAAAATCCGSRAWAPRWCCCSRPRASRRRRRWPS